MRKWIDLFEASLKSWDKTVNGCIDVFRNPSKAEYMRLFREGEGGRMTMCHNGDILVFSADFLHADIEDAYAGEAWDTQLFPTAMIWPGHCLLHHIRDFDRDVAVQAMYTYRANRNLKRMLGANFVLLGESGDYDQVPIVDVFRDWPEEIGETITEAREFEPKSYPAQLPHTEANLKAAKDFVFRKWVERFREKYPNLSRDESQVPTDLANSCKFSSLFARAVFGGKLRGNWAHQFVQTDDGTIIDLNIDASDVKEIIADGRDPHEHDQVFWGHREHKASVRSCMPRVKDWVKEFMAEHPLSEQILDTIASRYSPEKNHIYSQPSPDEFRSLLGRLRTCEDEPRGTMRGLLNPHTGEVYIWDGYYATHGGIKDHYGWSDAFHLILFPDRVRVLTAWRYERNGISIDEVRNLVENNKCLLRMYRRVFDIEVQP